MAGQPGFELVGPYAEGDAVREAIVKAGEEFGLRLVGGRAYSSNTLESGWIPSPLPAVYSGEKMKPYRQWLTADSYEAQGFDRRQLRLEEDRGLLPHALGHGLRLVHRLRARLHRPRGAAEDGQGAAPEEGDARARGTRTCCSVIGSQLEKGERGKFMEFPSAVYSMHPYDKVVAGGKTVGISTWIGYSSNERRMLTIAVLDAEHAEPGTEVTFVWGEENGGTQQADGRAAPADGDPRHRQPGALRRDRAQGLRRRRLAQARLKRLTSSVQRRNRWPISPCA